MSDRNGTFRAMFLVAIMVLSVVAMGGVFAGSAAAEDHDGTLVVDDDGTGDYEYESIQSAIDDAEDGYTIEVEDGTYEEGVVIDDINGLTLTAADGADPTIEGTLRIGDPSDTNGADNTTVSGFTFIDAEEGETRAIGITESNDVVG